MGYDAKPSANHAVHYSGIGVNLNAWSFMIDAEDLCPIFGKSFIQQQKEAWKAYNHTESVPPDLIASELFENYIGYFNDFTCDGVLGAFLSQIPHMRELVYLDDLYGDNYLFARDDNQIDVAYLTEIFGSEWVGPLKIICPPDEDE